MYTRKYDINKMKVKVRKLKRSVYVGVYVLTSGLVNSPDSSNSVHIIYGTLCVLMHVNINLFFYIYIYNTDDKNYIVDCKLWVLV